MKRMIIPALVAMSLAGAAQAQERPYEQSAQCLAEIGMLTNDRLDFGDPDMVDRAKRKGDALYAAFQRIIDARARTDELHVEFVESLRRQEAEGTSPRGAAEVTAAQFQRERAVDDAEDQMLVNQTPNCRWPSAPTEH
ncbi:hypothetical protein ACLBV5_09560 [Brevundimonas sp. M1A4_2e]